MSGTRIIGPLFSDLANGVTPIGDINIPLGDKISFGDGDTYVDESIDDVVKIVCDSVGIFSFSKYKMSGQNHSVAVVDEGRSPTVPNFTLPSDTNSGLGAIDANNPCITAGGVMGLSVAEVAGAIGLSSPAVFTDCVKISASNYGNPSTNPPATKEIGVVQGEAFTVGTDKAFYKGEIPANYAGGDLSLILAWSMPCSSLAA